MNAISRPSGDQAASSSSRERIWLSKRSLPRKSATKIITLSL
jgi:hypothetical protein